MSDTESTRPTFRPGKDPAVSVEAQQVREEDAKVDGEWQKYFSRRFGELIQSIGLKEKKVEERGVLSASKRAAAYRAVARAARIKSLLNDPLWVDDLVPALAEEAVPTPWSVGDLRTIEQVAMGRAFDAGRAKAIENFRARLVRWAQDGEEARQLLERDNHHAAGKTS